MLADLETVERRLQNLARKVKGGDKEALEQEGLLEARAGALAEGRPARTVAVSAEERAAWRLLQLLTQARALRPATWQRRGGHGQRPFRGGGGDGAAGRATPMS
jgi:ribosome-binding ATPase YchF (GTP1/OBG family)